MKKLILVAMAMILALSAFGVRQAQPAHAGQIIVPDVPDQIKVPKGNKVFLVGNAIGTQNYVCQPSGSGFAWILFTPQATLFGEDGGKIISHFFSPNPFEPNTNPRVVSPIGTIRATWEYRDTSTVWAKLHQNDDGTSGSVIMDQDAIAWLLLDAVGNQDGPTGGDVLTKTTFVQRLSTTGGLAPKTGCSSLSDVGKQAFIPYTADYFFYQKAD